MRAWRRELLGDLQGQVLEIGAGTGASLELYPREGLELQLCEPDAAMRVQMERKVAALGLGHVRVNASPAERLHAESASVDYVVSSLVCCTVPDLSATLAEVQRVLKPGGSLVFLEHVAAPAGTRRRVWQERLNPLWGMFAGGCHLNRDTEAAIQRAGFEIAEIKRESMRKAAPLMRPTVRGVARRR